MATLGKAQIADKDSDFDSGAAFLLSHKSATNKLVVLSPNQEVEVREGSPYAVARIKGASGATEAFDISYELIQKGLDILSISGKEQLATRDVFNDSLLWWRSSSGQTLRITSVAPFPVRISAGVEIVQTKDGKIVQPSPRPAAIYHESLRHFRLSQVADDVFEAFRNMYLAFEGLLAFLAPRNPGEREEDWLKRALALAGTRDSLKNVFGSTVAIDGIFQQIYKDIRCAVFHSKTGPRLLPQNLSDRKKVSEGHDKLTGLYLALAEIVLHYRYHRSWLFPGVHDNSIRSLLGDSPIILVSDSDSPFDASETAESPAYKSTIEAKAEYRPELSEPGLVFVLGALEAAQLSGIERIGRVAVKKDDKILIAETIKAELKHPGIDILEIQLGSRLENKGAPKQQYGA